MLLPSPGEATWIAVAKLDDIPVRAARVLHTETHRIALFRTSNDEIFALEDRCPHRNGPLSEGLVHGDQVTCPLHQMVFELRSGQAVYPDEGCVKRFAVALRDDTVWLDTTAQPAPAVATACRV